MDGAALLLLVSSVGVGFGWQPMPDGSPKYEYIVQLEPELAATLADGKSIPIVSEPPEEIQPIGRIRVVVGRGELPRQRLVTRLKPANASAQMATDGVALAQYQGYDQQRYGAPQTAPSGQPAAPAASAESAWNQQPAQQAGSQPDSSEWNSGGAGAQVTPTGAPAATGRQLFGTPAAGESAWNSSTPRVAAAPNNNPLAKVGDSLNSATAPLRQGLDKVDSQIRAGADKVGSRTRELVDELSHPFNGRPAAASPGDPRAAASTNSAATQAPQWNGGTANGGIASSQAAPGADTTTNWNGQQTTPSAQSSVPGSTGRYGQTPNSATALDASTQGSAAGAQWNGGGQVGANANTQSGGIAAPPLTTPTANDPWASAPDPRSGAGLPASGGAAPGTPVIGTRPEGSYAGAGSTWPATGTPYPDLGAPAYLNPASQAAGSTAGVGDSNTPATGGKPEIRSGMLSEPPGKPLDGTSATPQLVAADAGRPGIPATAAATKSSIFGQTPPSSDKTTEANQRQTTPTGAANATTGGRDNAALVLLAWVLLTGSIAGNGYLFWSYLDIRHKYRLMVRKSARAVGRYSAA